MVLQLIKVINPKTASHNPTLNPSAIPHLLKSKIPTIPTPINTPHFLDPQIHPQINVNEMVNKITTPVSLHQFGNVNPTNPVTAPNIRIPITNPRIDLFALSLLYNFPVDSSIFLILSTLVLGFVLSLWLIRRWLSAQKPSDPLLSQWLSSVQSSLDNSTRLMADVQHSLGEMSEVGRGIKSLQDFLASPKLRGGLGEEILGQMIGQTFPKNAFHLQYSFKSGVKVDAVLKTDAGLLCIDSKFPMGDFNVTDIKKHIGDIAKKYILPEEGTMDFALMYIPSESVYYEVVTNRELSNYSRSNRVYPVSPNTLYAHLQVLLQSLQGKELEAKSRAILQALRAAQKDYDKVSENLGVLNRHLTNAFNQMSQVTSSTTLLGQKLNHTDQLSEPEN